MSKSVSSICKDFTKELTTLMNKKLKSSAVQNKLADALLSQAQKHQASADVKKVEATQAAVAIKNIESLFGVDPC